MDRELKDAWEIVEMATRRKDMANKKKRVRTCPSGITVHGTARLNVQ